jgi:hypothetical protein
MVQARAESKEGIQQARVTPRECKELYTESRAVSWNRVREKTPAEKENNAEKWSGQKYPGGCDRYREPNPAASGRPNVYYLKPGDFLAIYSTKGLLSGGIDGAPREVSPARLC